MKILFLVMILLMGSIGFADYQPASRNIIDSIAPKAKGANADKGFGYVMKGEARIIYDKADENLFRFYSRSKKTEIILGKNHFEYNHHLSVSVDMDDRERIYEPQKLQHDFFKNLKPGSENACFLQTQKELLEIDQKGIYHFTPNLKEYTRSILQEALDDKEGRHFPPLPRLSISTELKVTKGDNGQLVIKPKSHEIRANDFQDMDVGFDYKGQEILGDREINMALGVESADTGKLRGECPSFKASLRGLDVYMGKQLALRRKALAEKKAELAQPHALDALDEKPTETPFQ